MLGVAVGFLPLLATRLGLPAVVGAIAVGTLALASTLLQPVIGKLRDRGRISTRAGSAAGLAIAALGLGILAVAPNAVTLFAAAWTLPAGRGILAVATAASAAVGWGALRPAPAEEL